MARAVVLCPLEIERRAVAAEVGGAAEVIRTGPGAVRIRAAVEALAEHPPGIVILAGLAGALAPAEDVPRIGHVIDLEFGMRYAAPRIAPGDGAPVTVVGVGSIVGGAQSKRKLHSATGAELVDCESHAFARACERAGLAWAIVRGVSDGPDDWLPDCAAGWVSDEGVSRPARVAVDLLARPGLLRSTMRVGKRSKRVLPDVGRHVLRLLHAEGAGGQGVDARATIPVGPGVETLLVYGGAFDPPHRGHVELPVKAREALGAEWLLYVPAAAPPLRADAPFASDRDRLRMLRAALAGVQRVGVSDIDLVRAGPSYTIDTVRALRKALPRVKTMRLLIGADQAAQFHKWREAKEILKLAEPAVLLRPPLRSPERLLEELGAHWPAEEVERWRKRILSLPVMDISATRVREVLGRYGPQAAELRGVVPEGVLGYIGERGLYAGGARKESGRVG